MVHKYNEYYLSQEKREIMMSMMSWMSLEVIVLITNNPGTERQNIARVQIDRHCIIIQRL